MDKEVNVGSMMRSLGVANKRIETLEKELEAEKAKGDAYEQLQDINLAMITAIVRNLGEVKVGQEQINEILEKKIQCRVSYDSETMEYILRIPAEEEEDE